MKVWLIWGILGIFLIILEIFTPGFVVATFGIGCLFAAIPAAFSLGLIWQFLVFSLVTLLSFFIVRPIYLKYLFPEEKQIPTNVDALIGQEGVVIEQIDNLRNTGRVKVGGEDWKAVSKSGDRIARETAVRILAIEGVKLIVEPWEKSSIVHKREGE